MKWQAVLSHSVAVNLIRAVIGQSRILAKITKASTIVALDPATNHRWRSPRTCFLDNIDRTRSVLEDLRRKGFACDRRLSAALLAFVVLRDLPIDEGETGPLLHPAHPGRQRAMQSCARGEAVSCAGLTTVRRSVEDRDAARCASTVRRGQGYYFSRR